MSAIVCIPARLESSRLERKLLAKIGGRTMLERTHEVAVAAGCGPVLVLVDSDKLAAAVASFGGEPIMTDPEAESGTARIASIADQLDADVVVNLQGDAPLTDPEIVAQGARVAEHGACPVTMPVYPLTDWRDVDDPNVVKVVRAGDGRALYCSRSPVPHVRDCPPQDWIERAHFWGHVGLYAYKREFLLAFSSLPEGELERTERLEQLRFIEAGVDLDTFEVDAQGPSVDTQGQLERVRTIFAARDGDQAMNQVTEDRQ